MRRPHRSSRTPLEDRSGKIRLEPRRQSSYLEVAQKLFPHRGVSGVVEVPHHGQGRITAEALRRNQRPQLLIRIRERGRLWREARGAMVVSIRLLPKCCSSHRQDTSSPDILSVVLRVGMSQEMRGGPLHEHRPLGLPLAY
jgi:hypothetical protein